MPTQVRVGEKSALCAVSRWARYPGRVEEDFLPEWPPPGRGAGAGEDEDGDGRKKRGFFKSRKNKRQRGLDSAAGSTHLQHRGCFAQVGFWIENKILRGRLAVWRWMVQRYHGADMLERITAPSDAIFFAEVVTSMTVRNPKP